MSADSLHHLLVTQSEEAHGVGVGGVEGLAEAVGDDGDDDSDMPAARTNPLSLQVVNTPSLATNGGYATMPSPLRSSTGSVRRRGQGMSSAASANSSHVESFFKQHRGGLRATLVEGPGVYYMGIIDVLQRWDFWKKLEYWTKTRLLCKNRHGISAVHYDECVLCMCRAVRKHIRRAHTQVRRYAERFYQRVAHEIIDDYETLVENTVGADAPLRGHRASVGSAVSVGLADSHAGTYLPPKAS